MALRDTKGKAVSAYIQCPRCKDDSLDVDTLQCDCGYYAGAEDVLQSRISSAVEQLERIAVRMVAYGMPRDVGFVADIRGVISNLNRTKPNRV